MPRFGYFRVRRTPKYLASIAATVIAALVAVFLTQTSDRGAAASASPARVPTIAELVAGLEFVATGYPGGLPALLNLFDTGECAGVESYDSAPSACRSLIDRIAAAGVRTSAPPTETTETTAPPTLPTTTLPTTTLPTTTLPTTTLPTTTLPTTTTTMTPPTTTLPTTTTTMPPPQPLPPLLVAVGDSVTSGHEARPHEQPDGTVVWRTVCDDPVTSWADNLRRRIGVVPARYYNFAHSGATTANVRAWSPYTNPCGVVSQQARTQLDDAILVLRNNPSRAGAANVAVATAGINDTNWVTVAEQLVRRQLGFGGVAPWVVANAQACTDYVLGNPNGNPTPGAPAGAIPPGWDGQAQSGMITTGAAQIAIGLIAADPGAQVRYLLYYRWGADPFLPPNCVQAAQRATDLLNGWIMAGVVIAKIMWTTAGGNQNRIDGVCAQNWRQGPLFVQMQPFADPVSGWPHPNANGRADLAACVDRTLPRAQGGGIG